MNEIAVAIIGLVSTILLTLIGVYTAKKYNIGPNQEKLVATLKDLVDAQQSRIAQLEETVQQNAVEIGLLRKEVKELKNLTVEQALTISHLEDELSRKGG